MSTVHISANSRLTANIKQQAVLSAQQAVIETPKVMTLAQWWQEWLTAGLLNGQIPFEEQPNKILNSFEAQWLFERVLLRVLDKNSAKRNEETSQERTVDENDADLPELALLNIPATAKQLYQAWVLCAEWIDDWQGDALLESTFQSEETELFKQVLQNYLKQLQQKNWQDEALFAQSRLKWLSEMDSVASPAMNRLPEHFQLHGFDDLSPNAVRWKNAVEAHGCTVDLQDIATNEYPQSFQLKHHGLTCYPAQDLFDEAQQVAIWAMQQLQQLLQQKPLEQVRVAVVAPNVSEYKEYLSQCLDEQLYLQGLGNLNSALSSSVSRHESGTAINQKLYNFSLGESLLSVPLVENAWHTLNLFLQPHKSVAYQGWSEWLISPYTLGDFTQRQQADAQFRKLQWANLQWPNLLETKAAQSVPESLVSAIQNWQKQFKGRANERVSLLQFVEQAQLLLSQIGWTGSRTLNSTEYQQKTAFENALTQFSALTDFSGQQGYHAWLTLFKRFLAEQVHQPQSVGHQPIQIMGMLEAGGQQFDALWVLGLTNEAWPRMPSPNPFIPMHMQRQLGMPRSDAVRELIYAQQVSQRLVDSAPQVIWSYPQQSGEAMLLPNAILPGLESELVNAWQPQSYHSLAEQLLQQADSHRLDWVVDDVGMAIEPGSSAPGGTGILQAQSQCPLMAYVDYRLGAKYGFMQVEDSLQNTNQGSLIHAVLELFWKQTETQVALLALSEEEKIERLQTHIDTAFSELEAGLSEGFVKVEQARILELCLQWLELEAQRESFAVKETEAQHTINLAGIDFKIIVDRVDQVAGQSVILDYKTGRASINKLMQTPLAAPQLAVYLLAVSEEVSGIGYALLHSDDGVKISAIVEDEEVLTKSRTVQVFAKLAEKEDGEYYQTTWNDFLEHLKQQVVELAQQIQQGQAEMLFENLQAIQYAEGYLALRVPEVLKQRQDMSTLLSEQDQAGEM